MSHDQGTTSDASAASPASRGRFWGMLGLYVVWITALATLALRTSNPPQLNLAQVSRATLLVTAIVHDIDSGRCQVTESFSPGELPNEIVVTNLSQTAAEPGSAYLLPLVRDLVSDEPRYRIVDWAERGIPPIVYPAGTEIEQQLRDWQQPRQ